MEKVIGVCEKCPFIIADEKDQPACLLGNKIKSRKNKNSYRVLSPEICPDKESYLKGSSDGGGNLAYLSKDECRLLLLAVATAETTRRLSKEQAFDFKKRLFPDVYKGKVYTND